MAAQRKDWFSLQEASKRLGVSPATLRSWADQGRVHAFRTPGGHRRFSESDLAAFAASARRGGSVQPVRVLADAALGRTRFEVSEGWLSEQKWFQRFPPESLEEHRRLGRRVVLALSEVLSLPDDEAQLESRAAELGREYSQLNRKEGTPLADAIRAFLFFRNSFLESLAQLAVAVPAVDSLTMMRKASRFVDEMLLTIVELYVPREADRPDDRQKGVIK